VCRSFTDGKVFFGRGQAREEPEREESFNMGKLWRNAFEKIGKGIGKGLKFPGWCAAAALAALAFTLSPHSQSQDIDQTWGILRRWHGGWTQLWGW
jgi:hypothetical protein